MIKKKKEKLPGTPLIPLRDDWKPIEDMLGWTQAVALIIVSPLHIAPITLPYIYFSSDSEANCECVSRLDIVEPGYILRSRSWYFV